MPPPSLNSLVIGDFGHKQLHTNERSRRQAGHEPSDTDLPSHLRIDHNRPEDQRRKDAQNQRLLVANVHGQHAEREHTDAGAQ